MTDAVNAIPPQNAKLRTDLIISRQETADGVCYVVKDPARGRFFRLRETEYFIAGQLDGNTPGEMIRQSVEREFAASLSEQSLQRFTQKLHQLGLLDTPHEPEPRSPGASRVRGNLLYLRLNAIDPDRLLERLLPKIRFFFTAPFVVLSAALTLLAAALVFANSQEIAQGFRTIFRAESLLLAWLVMIAVMVSHELAHGLTCKHFGGRVHEMGFMLLFLMPTLYCNVSDAWLFPERSKRLWVTFAGAYFEIFIWAVSVVLWRLTAGDTALHYVALVVMATSGVKTFFNLNPLIKLDGYYLLSDWLEIPNLRQRASAYLRGRIRNLFRAGGAGLGVVTPRQKRIYLSYGVLAAGYSCWLLAFVVFSFGSYLTEQLQGWGFALCGVILLSMFRAPAKRMLPKVSVLAGIRRNAGRFSRRVQQGAVVALLAAALFLFSAELKVGGEFTVLPLHNADIRAEVEGIIGEIAVKGGDGVKEGDVIAQLTDRDYRAELAQTEANLAEKRARLLLLLAGTRQEEIDLAGREVETATTRLEHSRHRYDEAIRMHREDISKSGSSVAKSQERLDYARKYLRMSEALAQQGLISRRELQQAEERVAVRAKELEEAQADLQMALASELAAMRTEWALAEQQLGEAESRLRMLEAGSRPEEIKAAQAEIARLEAQRAYLEEQLRLLRVVSPIDGVITTPKLEEKVGELVKKGDLIAEVHQLRSVTAEIAVPEKEIAEVLVGQKVDVKARAYPSKTFHGVVTSIAPIVTAGENRSAFPMVLVTTQIDNEDGFLKGAMTGHAKIHCGSRRLAELITRRLVRYLRVEFWSWW